MKKFYCVRAEFYDSGKTLACVTSNAKRGKNQYRQVPGMTAFNMWFVSEVLAARLLENIKSGAVNQDDILSVWSGLEDWENEMFGKTGRAAA